MIRIIIDNERVLHFDVSDNLSYCDRKFEKQQREDSFDFSLPGREERIAIWFQYAIKYKLSFTVEFNKKVWKNKVPRRFKEYAFFSALSCRGINS
jgi:hypothetical protein